METRWQICTFTTRDSGRNRRPWKAQWVCPDSFHDPVAGLPQQAPTVPPGGISIALTCHRVQHTMDCIPSPSRLHLQNEVISGNFDRVDKLVGLAYGPFCAQLCCLVCLSWGILSGVSVCNPGSLLTGQRAEGAEPLYVTKFGFHTVTCCGFIPQVSAR